MKKIIVTAPNSALGECFIKYAKNKYKITTIGRRKADIVCDFAKEQPAIPFADSIVHIAAAFQENTNEEIEDMNETNVGGLLKVCFAAKKANIQQIVYISSISSQFSSQDQYYNFYALTKRHAEELAELYCRRFGIKLAIIRPSQIFGSNIKFKNHQKFLYMLIEKIIHRENIHIYGENDACRNYIYVDNICNIITRVIEEELSGAFNAISPQNIRISEVINEIARVFGHKPIIIRDKDKPDIIDLSFNDRNSVYEKLKLEYIDFRKGMEKIAEEWRQNNVKR